MRSYAASIGFAVLIFLAWEALVRGLEIPAFVAPAPSAILKALVTGFAEANYIEHCLVTVSEALSGFVLGAALGLGAGILIVISPVMEKIIYPWIVGLQSMPKVAIAPLLVVWFGFGLASKVVVVTLVTLFPVLVNVVAGLRNVDQERLDLMLGLSATRWQIMRYLRLPNALPFIFAGLNTAIVFSVTAAIVGEFVGATKGLGYLILQANYSLDIAAVFALLIVLAGVGMLLHSLVQFAESRIVFWSKSEDMNPGAP